VAHPASAISAPRPRSLRWPVVGLLSIGVIIAYIDRINLSFALPDMSKSMALSAVDSGRLLSAFFWSYAALQVPAGWLVDRYGVKWPYTFSFLFWSLISAATALVKSLPQLLVVRVLLGIGEAIVTPGSLCYIRSHFAEKQRGLAIGIYMAGTKFGPGIGGPIAAYLVANYGWQGMFAITGLGFLPWLIPWLLLVGNDRPGAAARPAAGEQPTLSWRAILSSPVLWGTFLATFCYMYFVYFCMTWMPIYFKQRHNLTLTGSGWFTFMSFGGMATIAILAGLAADRLIAGGRNPVTVRKAFTIAGFLLASTQIVGAISSSIPVTLFFAVFSLSGLGLTMPNYWALTQTLMPGAAIGRVAGMQNMAANIAGIVSPWLTGWIIQQTGRFEAPIVAIAFWLALGIGCYVFLVREKYAPR